ncbi:MFS transporter [Lapillicoccus jejuensis]|uniref:DHA1 family inner membrane transport protein n=1 Tax=Lapillicoccus jejuensis TaxID=402171 RepID=A0A542E6E5_9MICO|nr:MFS transporter [Lapillicoccus jejuensis]TQJ10859.1 DHA1 family inner membrane transport protein [Lapillicoccus jejuensis]
MTDTLTPVTTSPPSPPARADRTRVPLALAALATGGFAIGTTEFVTMGLLPQVAAGTGVDIPTAGHYVSAYALGVVVGAPLLTVLVARRPRKGVLLGLMGVFAVFNVASGFATSYGALMGLRFLAGLPHGAYFGIGSVVAASLVPKEKRTAAVASMLIGLGVANVVGVPLTTRLGQDVGWAVPYWLVGIIGALTVLAIALWIPRQPAPSGASVGSELSALRRGQVWFALVFGTVGFGGMFATYSYITPTMTHLAGFSEGFVPVVLGLYGVGQVLGMVVAGRVARYGVLRMMAVSTLAIAVALALFGWAAHVPALAVVFSVLLGFLPSILVPLLQTRLMDVARDGQSLAAALNHSTLNIANALGAWLGSLVLAAGYGYEWPSRIGAVLAVLGLGVLGLSVLVARRQAARV